jgi:protocatechuate 3,4-dioxygenase beta subunit
VNVAYTLKYYGGDSRKIEARTADDGRTSIQFSAAELKSLTYQTEKTNYLTLRGEWFDQELSAIENEYQIKLSPGVEIGGTVTDEAGKPIAGAEVTFDEPMNMLLSASHAPRIGHAEMWTVQAASTSRRRTRTAIGRPNASGRQFNGHRSGFIIRILPTRLVLQNLPAPWRQKAKGESELRRLEGAPRPAHALTRNQAQRPVVNEAGDPLPGIQVTWAELIVSPHARDQLLGQRTVTTDAAGEFSIPHAPSKYLIFWAQLPDYAPVTVECDPASGAEIELRVAKGVALDGEILDGQNSAPVTGARLSFADFGIWRGIRWGAVTDGNGHFEWSHAPSERFQLQIEKDGFITQNKIVQARANEKLSIRLNRTLHITGRVLDAETKEPIRYFHIDQLSQGYPGDLERGDCSFTTVEGSNGVYSVDTGRLWVEPWADGYPHEFAFRVRADRYTTSISRVFSARSNDFGNVSYDVELKPVSQVSGMVLDPDGPPIAGAQVALKLAASRLLLSGKPSLSSTVAGSFQLTDAQGRFRVNADNAAQGLVAVHEKGFAEIQTNEFSTNVTLKLQPWGRIEGTVWEYGNLITNQGVWASCANATWPESLRMELRTNSDAQGTFAFDFVPAGKFRIYRMIPTGSGASSGPGKVVEVRPSTTTTIKLGGEGRPVVGRFKITNPYVAVDWQGNGNYLYARSTTPKPPKDLKTREDFDAWRKRPEIQQAYDCQRNYPVRVAADGSFRMDEVVPGQYDMRIQVLDPRDRDAMAYSKYIATATKSFEVPQPPLAPMGPCRLI